MFKDMNRPTASFQDNNTRPRVDSWDGPLFRLFLCGEGAQRLTAPFRHNLFLDALEPQGAWLMTLSGCGYYETGGREHPLERGSVLALHRPARGSILHDAGRKPWRAIWVHVAGKFALETFDFIVSKYGVIHYLPLNCDVLKRAKRLVGMTKSGKSYPARVWSRLTYEFLMSWWGCAESHVQPVANLLSAAAFDSKLLSYHPGSIQGYAQKMGYSRSYLARKLKEQWHEPPGRVLRRTRLEEAARLLRTSSLQVKHIASKIGYESNTAFIRAFKQQYKISPLKYRHHHA
jgi:AraC-like DNA-binding protein